MGEISQKRVTNKKAYIFCVLGTAMLFLAVPLRADAYIDLGLAGSLFQAVYLIVIAGIAFVLSLILFFWKQIKQSLRRRIRKGRTPDNSQTDDKVIHQK